MHHPILRFFQALHVTECVARQASQRLIFDGTGLTQGQFQILHHIQDQGGSIEGVHGLVQTNSCTPGNLSRVMKLLETSGMIHREHDAHDRRKIIVHITPVGQQEVQHIEEKIRTTISDLEHIGATIDLEALEQQLHTIEALLRDYIYENK